MCLNPLHYSRSVWLNLWGQFFLSVSAHVLFDIPNLALCAEIKARTPHTWLSCGQPHTIPGVLSFKWKCMLWMYTPLTEKSSFCSSNESLSSLGFWYLKVFASLILSRTDVVISGIRMLWRPCCGTFSVLRWNCHQSTKRRSRVTEWEHSRASGLFLGLWNGPRKSREIHDLTSFHYNIIIKTKPSFANCFWFELFVHELIKK